MRIERFAAHLRFHFPGFLLAYFSVPVCKGGLEIATIRRAWVYVKCCLLHLHWEKKSQPIVTSDGRIEARSDEAKSIANGIVLTCDFRRCFWHSDFWLRRCSRRSNF
ncbi:unnamed protein product [Cuscuta epithymum]|uniref:Secreted protein n=1 Tax=Cuscuta epithymum TaxID=186058 RepID=A0AAV0F4K9_9ASTE|nr:unnamed protein product [Cuscuta epithymum]